MVKSTFLRTIRVKTKKVKVKADKGKYHANQETVLEVYLDK